MQQLVASGQAQQAVGLFTQLPPSVFTSPVTVSTTATATATGPNQSHAASAYSVLLAALEAAGDVNGLRRAATAIAATPAARSSVVLQRNIQRAEMLCAASHLSFVSESVSESVSASASTRAALKLASKLDSNNDTGSDVASNESDAVKVAAAGVLLDAATPDAAFVALGLLQSLADDRLDAPVTAALVVRTFTVLRARRELTAFLAAKKSHPWNVWAEASIAASNDATSPGSVLRYLRNLLADLVSPSSISKTRNQNNKLEIAANSAQAARAIRAGMKTLSDFASLESASAFAAEAFGVFRSKTVMAQAGLDGAFLVQHVQSGYFNVIVSALKNANQSVLSRNGTSAVDLLNLASMYIESFSKGDSALSLSPDNNASQESFKRVFQMYLHCIPLESTIASTSNRPFVPTYTAEGALTFFNTLKTNGFNPSVEDYNSLMALLSKPYISKSMPNTPSSPTTHPSRKTRINHLRTLLDSLNRTGLTPTHLTYSHLLSACSTDFQNRNPDPWYKSLIDPLIHQTKGHTYTTAKSLLKLHLQSGNLDAGTHLWTSLPAAGIHRGLDLYKTVFKTASQNVSVKAKRFAGFIVSDLVYDMDRDRVRRDGVAWFYLVKCCLVAHDLMAARRFLVEARDSGVQPAELGAKVYGIVARLTFLNEGAAKLYGRDFLREVRGLGCFGSGIPFRDLKGAFEFYSSDRGKAVVDSEIVEALIGVTDFSGIEGKTVTEVKEEWRRKLLGKKA
ncbi:hypothetical protein HDU79_007336 [Rhizoclosmatium sp. JEL0117]|nr:hypothetical protein HDU79_007336 [Rhizoclosmatium sp. JEL0117]